MDTERNAIICLGSNSSCRAGAVGDAFAFMSTLGIVIADSGGYMTPPEGTPADAEPYFNRLVMLRTDMDAASLQRRLKEYETPVRMAYTGAGVAVDLDVVVFDGDILRHHDFDAAYFRKGLQLAGLGHLIAEPSFI